jgi:drug/metabolite transporter (DMT)-like permease
LTRNQAILELVFAGTLWGFGFTATIWALQSISVSALVFYRFFGAFLIGLFILLAQRISWKTLKKEATLSLLPGLILLAMLLFQTAGLLSTTATNSGFITTLYVI